MSNTLPQNHEGLQSAVEKGDVAERLQRVKAAEFFVDQSVAKSMVEYNDQFVQ